MLYRLLKFVIISRFSKQLLIVFGVLLVYALFLSSASSSSSSTVYHYYGPVLLTVFFVLPIASGGIAVLKSDRDFLFTLPLKRSDLAFSLFVVQFLSFGLFIIYGFAYSFSYLKPVFPFAVIDFIGIMLTVTALGPLTYSLKSSWRTLLALVFAIWSLSAFLKFPFSPSSIYVGYPLYAATTSIVLAVITVPLAFRSLSRVDLDMMKAFTRYSSREVKRVRRFSGMTPLMAIFAENFFVVEVSGRMNAMGAGGSYRSGRFRLSRGILVTAVLAVAYYFIFTIKVTPKSAEVALLVISIYSLIFVMFLSMGVLGNERLWLGFMSRSPTDYLRDLMLAKSLSFVALFLPLALSNFLLALKGDEMAFTFGLTLLVIMPSLLVMVVYASAFLNPLQIKEELLMPGQFNLRQLATMIPILPVLFILALVFGAIESNLVTDAIIISVLTAVIMAGTAFWLITSRRVGEKVIEKLVAAGFI